MRMSYPEILMTAIEQDIDDLRCELEEANECGDLEDRMELAQEIARLEQIQLRGNEKWIPCGLCHGNGKQKEFGEIWDCPACSGRGGSWQ